jgi:NDP-sugar pyrophosphorylase family protein
MGDKCSIKRSVLGPMCKLGSGVKIINSVLMEGCAVEDGCHLQSSILCSGAHLQVLLRSPCGLQLNVLLLTGIRACIPCMGLMQQSACRQ